MWSAPVGLGAMRTRTDTRVGYSGALRRPRLGRHQAGARPRGRDRGRLRAALRPEPACMAVPGARPGRPRALPRAARRGGARRRLRPRDLPDQPREPARRDLRQVRHDAPGDDRDRGRDRGGRCRRPRRIASRRRARGRARPRRAGARAGARPDDGHDLAAPGELRRRGRHDRPFDRGAVASSTSGSAATRGSASASTRATSSPRGTTWATRTRSPECSIEVDETIGLDRLRALHVNDSAAPLGSNRDRHANVGEGLIGERLGAFLAHPAVQQLPALLEVPGPDGHGPDAAEVRKLRELHARWAKSGKRARTRRARR